MKFNERSPKPMLTKATDVLRSHEEAREEDELNRRLGIDDKLKKQILDALKIETNWGPVISLQAKLSLLIVFPEEAEKILGSIDLDKIIQNWGTKESFYEGIGMLFDLNSVYQIDPNSAEQFKQAHPTTEQMEKAVLPLDNTPTSLVVKLQYMYAITKFLSGPPIPNPGEVIEQAQQTLQEADKNANITDIIFLELAYGLVRVKPELKPWIAEQVVKHIKSFTANTKHTLNVLNGEQVMQLGILKFFLSPDSLLSPRGTMMIPKKTQVRVAPPLPPRSLAA